MRILISTSISISLLCIWCFFLTLLLFPISTCWAKDSISSGITIKDGDELVSPKKKFSLGFFSSPEGSKNRYLAIWYVDFPTLKIWVANRDVPIMDNSGVLSITSNGNLILTDYSNRTIWSTTAVKHNNPKNPKAQILDSGNLVIRNSKVSGSSNSDINLWQSFDYLIPVKFREGIGGLEQSGDVRAADLMEVLCSFLNVGFCSSI
ncbi:hypothetical protein ZOSMA_75G00250 [Zostera marina]|uniref:Bulb-type lectin domain-containing protein n=1 Tax=Zostera marina TaxID=29655 RepID=A0A0K9NR84_ZOSMR|nr:hypothetical protein ZOSMA_75G00250 [Zostera marina]